MLQSGHRVRVIASSVPNKSTGPKVGSIGFTSNASSYPIEVSNYGVIAYRGMVLFNKFGHEAKFREENKDVIVVFPNITVNDDPLKKVNTLLENIKTDKFVTSVHNTLQLSGSKRPVVLLYPENVGYKSLSVEEKRSYIRKTINGAFFMWFQNLIRKGYYSNLISYDSIEASVLSDINQACHTEENRRGLYEVLLDSESLHFKVTKTLLSIKERSNDVAFHHYATSVEQIDRFFKKNPVRPNDNSNLFHELFGNDFEIMSNDAIRVAMFMVNGHDGRFDERLRKYGTNHITFVRKMEELRRNIATK